MEKSKNLNITGHNRSKSTDRNMDSKENKYSKYQVKPMKEKREFESSYIQQLIEKNKILENEKKKFDGKIRKNVK